MTPQTTDKKVVVEGRETKQISPKNSSVLHHKEEKEDDTHRNI
jgi:hypothetical protein